jgi:hypothetical protein
MGDKSNIEPIKLKPCPFCEGPPSPIVMKCITLGGGILDETKIPEDGMPATAVVFCHECGAQGEEIDEWVYDADDCARIEREAVERWQNRDSRHRSCYDGGEAEGLNLYPRPSK